MDSMRLYDSWPGERDSGGHPEAQGLWLKALPLHGAEEGEENPSSTQRRFENERLLGVSLGLCRVLVGTLRTLGYELGAVLGSVLFAKTTRRHRGAQISGLLL